MFNRHSMLCAALATATALLTANVNAQQEEPAAKQPAAVAEVPGAPPATTQAEEAGEQPAPRRSDALRLADRHTQNILGALEEETSFDFKAAGIPDVIDYFAEKHRVNFRVDFAAIQKIQFPNDAVYTAKMSEVSLRAALGIICRDMGLAYMIRNECLWLTTDEAAQQNPRMNTYNVGPLLTNDPAGNKLIAAIESVLPPETQTAKPLDLHAGGAPAPPRVMRISGGLLLVRATEPVHSEITSILIRMLEDAQERARIEATEAAIRAFQSSGNPGM